MLTHAQQFLVCLVSLLRCMCEEYLAAVLSHSSRRLQSIMEDGFTFMHGICEGGRETKRCNSCYGCTRADCRVVFSVVHCSTSTRLTRAWGTRSFIVGSTVRIVELVWTRKLVHVRYLFLSIVTSQEFYTLCLLVFCESSADWWHPRYVVEVLFLCNKPKTKVSSPFPSLSFYSKKRG